MTVQCVQKTLSKRYRRFGEIITRYRFYFLLIPILMTLLLSLGIFRLSYIRDLEYLFSPVNGRAKKDKETIDKLFPMNVSENFDFLRVINKIRFGVIIIISNDKKNMLEEQTFQTVLKIDEIIRNISITSNGEIMNYSKICAKYSGECAKMDVLDLKSRIKNISLGKDFITFPTYYDSKTSRLIAYPVSLGGVIIDNNSHIKFVEAIRLFYFLDNSNRIKDKISVKWEEEFLNTLNTMKFEGFEVTRIASSSLDNVTARNTDLILPTSPLSVILILLFSVLSCMSRDCIRSKPWLGIAASISAGLSIASTFGLLMLCGVEYADINISVPFLILGIGVDDSFVLIAAWRRSNPKLSVESRMGESYSEAAVSITLTSVTNFLSFSIGLSTSFPIVQIFCLYASIAILLAYIYQITFFGACMAYSGFREEQELHPLTFRKIEIKNSDVGERFLSHTNEIQHFQPEDNNVMIFFRDYIGEFLSKTKGKLLVLMAMFVYLGLSFWGAYLLKVGLDYRKLFPYGSYESEIMKNDFKYFTHYPDRIHIAITSPLDYSDTRIQDKIDDLLYKFENNSHISSSRYTESWLKYYKDFYTHHPHSWFFFHGYNLSHKQDFIDGLKIFLRLPWARRFKSDILFNENETEIIASRFFVQSLNVTYGELQKQLLLDCRNYVDNSGLPATIHSLWFPVYEHLSIIKTTALQSIGIAAVCVTITTLLFIPDFSCAVSITIAIASIQIGIIGFMSLWNVNLDMISVIALVMCVGFSVDYSAHICYSYITAKKTSSSERIKESLFAVGMPIVQGSVSTVLGLASLALTSSYSFTVVFKLVFLVILFATLHSIFAIPVLLSVFDIFTDRKDSVSANDTSSPLQKQTRTEIPNLGDTERQPPS
ncbi:patched domain-containing protein 3-like [Centruroides vittatus]|uniref:patched domain-containing protein 3-like n=1 Tax=Centruroides vittatus TaxID=120091 RepID=UPI00350F92DB